jgi:uncharacterized protein (TIRG00374 family)
MVEISQLSVSIVIPAHNEEDNIEQVVEHIIPVLRTAPVISSYELILVDDNSRDSTGEIIDRLTREDPHIHGVHRCDSPGFGNAIKAGFVVASGEVIIPVMGDLSDDPEDIVRLVEKISEGYDIAYGSRFVKGGELHGYPWQKLIANRLFNNSLRLSFGIPHRDITNAFKAYRKEVLDEIRVYNLESTGFDLTIEIAMKAHIAGFSSVEVPVRWYDRTAGEAKLKLSQNASIYGKRLLKLFLWGNLVSLRDLFHAVLKGSVLGIVLSVVLGIGILALIFSLSGFENIFTYLSHISVFWFSGCVVSIFFSFIIRTWRWSVLFRSSGYTIPRDILFKSIMFGWFLNYLVPARIGDFARALMIKVTDHAPFGVSLSTIVVERAFDTVTLAILLVILGSLAPNQTLVLVEAGAFAITGALVILLLFVYYGENILHRWFGSRFPSIQSSLSLLNSGLHNLSRNVYGIVLCFILSFIVWGFELGSVFFAAKAIGEDISFFKASIAGIVSFVLQSLPLTPAGIGIHEASISGVLQVFGIASSIGTAIALVDHFARGLVIYTIGLLCTIHLGFECRRYFRKKKLGNYETK